MLRFVTDYLVQVLRCVIFVIILIMSTWICQRSFSSWHHGDTVPLRRDDTSLSRPGQMPHLIHVTALCSDLCLQYLIAVCYIMQLKSDYLFKNFKCISCASFLACMLQIRDNIYFNVRISSMVKLQSCTAIYILFQANKIT